MPQQDFDTNFPHDSNESNEAQKRLQDDADYQHITRGGNDATQGIPVDNPAAVKQLMEVDFVAITGQSVADALRKLTPVILLLLFATTGWLHWIGQSGFTGDRGSGRAITLSASVTEDSITAPNGLICSEENTIITEPKENLNTRKTEKSFSNKKLARRNILNNNNSNVYLEVPAITNQKNDIVPNISNRYLPNSCFSITYRYCEALPIRLSLCKSSTIDSTLGFYNVTTDQLDTAIINHKGLLPNERINIVVINNDNNNTSMLQQLSANITHTFTQALLGQSNDFIVQENTALHQQLLRKNLLGIALSKPDTNLISSEPAATISLKIISYHEPDHSIALNDSISKNKQIFSYKVRIGMDVINSATGQIIFSEIMDSEQLRYNSGTCDLSNANLGYHNKAMKIIVKRMACDMIQLMQERKTEIGLKLRSK
jgi:hypothetical protein